jgi:hypothetical protein
VLFGADASAKFRRRHHHHDSAPSPDGGILPSERVTRGLYCSDANADAPFLCQQPAL